jgi:hypothetical protein
MDMNGAGNAIGLGTVAFAFAIEQISAAFTSTGIFLAAHSMAPMHLPRNATKAIALAEACFLVDCGRKGLHMRERTQGLRGGHREF